MDNSETIKRLNQIAEWYFKYNFNYIWLKTMLEKAGNTRGQNSVLITGSSHALNGIWEQAWEDATNCSMHSQDIYYDFKCAKTAIELGGSFSKCFIIMGYYIPFQDVSLSTTVREDVVASVYLPVLNDAHNWTDAKPVDPWRFLPDAGEIIRKSCEDIARDNILKVGTYYSRFVARSSFFDLKGKEWKDIAEEEKDALGIERTSSHNRIFKHKESFIENIQIIKDFVHLLNMHDVLPVVVITPFTKAYCDHVDKDMKAGVLEMLNKVEEELHFIDFNDYDFFDDADFVDTDHLNEAGAIKMSTILADNFGR